MNPKVYTNFDGIEGLHTRFWSHINNAELYTSLGPVVQFKKGDVVAPANIVPNYCYYVLEGRIMTLEYTSVGGDRYYNFNEEESLFLESCVLLQKAPPVAFTALTPSKLVRIPRETLLEQLRTDPDLALDMMTGLSSKFIAAMDQVREGTQFNVAWKVCNLLLTFSERYGVGYDGKILIKEKISQQMLANLLGVNRITMVRTIKELRECGLIEQVNGFYCIRDREKMQDFMENINNPW